MPQIVKTLLGEHQVNVEDKLTGSYGCGTTVSSIRSRAGLHQPPDGAGGIAYYFSHEADKHTTVFTDAAAQHQPFSGEVIPYHQTPSGGSTDEEGISQWALEDSVTPGIYSLDDYDFRKPNAWLFRAAEPGLAETAQHRRVRRAGWALCGDRACGVLRPHSPGALAGGASADSGHGHGGGNAGPHLHPDQRTVLQQR